MSSIEQSRYRYSRANPLAPPDWRYRIAKICHQKAVLPSFRRDDPLTWAVWKYLKKRDGARDSEQRSRVLRDYQPVTIAFRMHHGSLRHFRPVTEAYLLAGADDNSIATRLGMPPAAVRCFRLAFYDLGPRRASPLYVSLHLVGTIDADGPTTLDTPQLWKLVGYLLGAEALDQLFHVSSEADEKALKSGGLAAWFAQRTQIELQSKQFLAATNMNPHDQKHLGVLLKFLHGGLQAQKAPENHQFEQFEIAVQAMLQELPWCKGPELTPEQLRKWDDQAVELNDEELMLVAAGETPAHLEELANLSLPLMRDTPPKPPSAPGKTPY